MDTRNAVRGGVAVAAAAVGVATLVGVAGRTRERHPVAGPSGSPAYEGGSGPPLLLLHGVGGTWRVWLPVLPRLIRHHRVLAPTLMGHDGGLPLPVEAVPSVRTLVDAVEAELDERGLDRVHVVGNSLGGWIALELARRGRARSVVALSPAGAWRSNARMAALAAVMRASFGAGAVLAGRPDRPAALAAKPWARRLLVGSQVAHPERLDPDELAEALRAIPRSPVVLPLLRHVLSEPLQPLPHDPAVPIRVVWPHRDKVIPFEQFGAAMMDRLPGAELVRMRGTGHVPMSDDPVSIVDRILEVTSPARSRDDRPRQEARP